MNTKMPTHIFAGLALLVLMNTSLAAPEVADDVAQKALQVCVTRASGVWQDKCREDLLSEWSGATSEMNEVRLKRLTADVMAACKETALEGFASCADAKMSNQSEMIQQIVTTRAYYANIERAEKQEGERLSRVRAACSRTGIKWGSVRIGMTARQVKECGWGAPESINRTTTARRVAEQWVYGTHQYLYFDNGKLTAIQD